MTHPPIPTDHAELNRAAAEIMGWVFERTGYFDPKTGEFVRRAWNPCENIAQAFEVASKGNFLVLQRQYLCTCPWSASISFTDKWQDQKAAQADTPALAITRACVAAWKNKTPH